MKKVYLTAVCSVVLLSGCATEDFATLNQKVSDAAYSVNRAVHGGRVTSNSVSKTFFVDVDVDTVAARMKSYYGFSDVRIQATPGAFYRMVGNIGKNTPPDKLWVSLNKEGANRTAIELTHESAFESTQAASFRDGLFKRAEDVAAGELR